jgi:hypothetical protein
MKKQNLLIFGTAVFIAGIFSSCSKEQKVIAFDQDNIAKQLKFVEVKDRIKEMTNSVRGEIVIVSWDKWGRTSRDCRGFGLCKPVWWPTPEHTVPNVNPLDGCATILELDPNNSKYYFDILLAAKPLGSIPLNELNLAVDNTITLDTQSAIGNDLNIKQGLYTYDSSLGAYGGYRIYLETI